MLRILILIAAITLGGCVITPDYRYADGQGYYYGADEYDGVYVGGYGADDYYRYYDAGYLGYTQSWPYYAYGCPSYRFGWYAGSGCGGAFGFPSSSWGWSNYWGWGLGYPWGGYWNSWGYAPYWTVQHPRYRDRNLDALNAEKVRYLGNRRGAYREAASIAGARATQISRDQDIRHAIRRDAVRREATRREATRQSNAWHRPWPSNGPSREVERDLSRPQVTRPDMPRGVPERRHVPSMPDHGVTRMPMAPTRSAGPAPRVRSAPVAVPRAAPISRPSRSHGSSNSSVPRSAPRARSARDD